jgi:F-type H+-transporting ATPase subunit epsilon
MTLDPKQHPPHTHGNAHLTLQIVSLTGEHWNGQVHEVSLPGSEGRFGVMARHVPMLCRLREGMLHVHPAGSQSPFQVYVSGGYAEVQPGKLIVMADLAVLGEDLEQARAQAMREATASPMAQNFTDAAYTRMHMDLIERLRRRGPK